MKNVKVDKIDYSSDANFPPINCSNIHKYYCNGTFKRNKSKLILKLKTLTTVKNFKDEINYYCFCHNNVNAILIVLTNGSSQKTPERVDNEIKYYKMNIQLEIEHSGLEIPEKTSFIRIYIIHHECIEKDLDNIIELLKKDVEKLDNKILENLLKCNEKEYSYDSTRLEIEEIQSNCNDQYEKSTAKLAILKPKESGGGVITGE